MRLSVYVDQVDTHVHMRVFVNGALAGKLVTRFEEYPELWGMLEAAMAHKPGRWKVEFHDRLFWEKYEAERED